MAFTKNIEDVEEAVFTINHYLWVYLSLPQQEEPKQTEKIDWRICELSATGQHTKYTHDTEATIQLLIDTVNRQQEQINSLL